MPHPARLNLHLDISRVHAKAWARVMGILDMSRRTRWQAMGLHDWLAYDPVVIQGWDCGVVTGAGVIKHDHNDWVTPAGLSTSASVIELLSSA